MIFTLPNWRPTSSGLSDGDLFTGTLPKGAPTRLRVDEMSGSCSESLVLDGSTVAIADCSSMLDEVSAVPYFIRKSNFLNRHQSTVSQHAAAARYAKP